MVCVTHHISLMKIVNQELRVSVDAPIQVVHDHTRACRNKLQAITCPPCFP